MSSQINVIKACCKRESDYIKKLYKDSFPRLERKAFFRFNGSNILKFIIKNGNENAGFMICCRYKDLFFIDYFAVDEKYRNCGIGGKALDVILERFGDCRIFLEIEDPSVECDNKLQREKRLKFYLKKGFSVTDLKVGLMGFDALILAVRGTIDFSEYQKVYVHAYGRNADRRFRLKNKT